MGLRAFRRPTCKYVVRENEPVNPLANEIQLLSSYSGIQGVWSTYMRCQ